MNESQMQIFLEVSVRYFEKITGESAAVGSGILEFGKSHLLDYTGVIRVSGTSQGVVCLSMAASMIDELLAASQETDRSEEIQRDMIGEAASVIASNARKHFGRQFSIAVPETFSAAEAAALQLPFSRLALPIQWRKHQAKLVLALSETAIPKRQALAAS